MFYRRTRNIHIVILLLFLFLNFNIEPPLEEYVTLGFGKFGKVSTPGSPGKSEEKKPLINEPEKQKEKAVIKDKKVELPKTKTEDKNNVVIAMDTKKEKEETPPPKVKPLETESKSKSSGGETVGEGEGNFGFEIDFGGKGIRKLYNYPLPEYPQGVSKEIDVKLRFTIMPDGTVGKITPLIKADTRLETAAINSLRQWRFEPLPQNQKQLEQIAVIVFPYRLQ